MIVVILSFVKFYTRGNIATQEQTNITPTIVVKKQTNTTVQNNSGSSNSGLIEKYNTLQTEEEKENFFNTLTEEQQDFLSDEKSIDNNLENDLPSDEESINNSLKKDLPYESNTFTVNKHINQNVLLVKAKGDDFNQSKNDLMKWLEENTNQPNDVVLVWEE